MELVLGLLVLILAILATYALSTYCFPCAPARLFFFAGPAMILSLNALIGVTTCIGGLNSMLVAYFLSYLVVIGIFYRNIKAPTSVLSPSHTHLKRFGVFSLVFLAAFSYYLYPSLPHFSLPTTFGDANLHFWLIRNIYEHGGLTQWGVNGNPFFMETYPPGMHLNAALLSDWSGLPPLLVVYPFLSALMALSVTISVWFVHMFTKRVIPSLVALLFLVFSVYPLSALVGWGFWSQVQGIYLVFAFLVVFREYRKNPNKRLFGALVLIQAGLMLTYYFYAPITLLLYFAIVFEETFSATKTKRILVFSALSGTAFFLYLLYFSSHFLTDAGHFSPQRTIDGVLSDQILSNRAVPGVIHHPSFYNIGFIPVALAFIGIFHSIRTNEPVLLYLSGVLSLLLLVSFLLMVVDMLGDYYLAKLFYMVIFPLSIFSGIGTSFICDFIPTRAEHFQSNRDGFLRLMAISLVVVVIFLFYHTSPEILFSSEHQQNFRKEWMQYNRTGGDMVLMWYALHDHCNESLFYVGSIHPWWLWSMGDCNIRGQVNESWGSSQYFLFTNISECMANIDEDDIVYRQGRILFYEN